MASSHCLAHRWSLLVEELLHFGLHAGWVEVHNKEERYRAATRKVPHAWVDIGFKAIKEEGVQLDDVVVQGQLAEDFILRSELITSLHRKTQ